MLYRNIDAVLATAVGCEQPSQITPKDVACWSQDRVSEWVSESLTNKFPGAGVQTSYVHSSKIYGVVLVASIHYYNGV